MFTPSAFRQSDTAAILDLCRRHGFATLITRSDGQTFVTHIPLLVDSIDDGGFRIVGHVAKANLHAGALEAGCDTVAVFLGPHAYISPNWYRHEQRVPTWNYAAVHFHGVPQAISDPAAVAACVVRLTEKYETLVNPADPWAVDPSRPEVARELKAIVMFQMDTKTVYAKFKFNQNHPAESRQSVADALITSKDPLERMTAEIMLEHLRNRRSGRS